MECDVCGRSMLRWPLEPNRWAEESWSCCWCFAATHVGGEWFELSRPPYAYPDRRWETAIAEGLASDSVHAFGSFETTLCGIEFPGMSPSDYIWLPDRPSACSDCRKTALVIDERWPRELRDEQARTSIVKQLPK